MHPVKAFVIYKFLATLGLGMTATTSSLLQLDVGMSISDIVLVNIVFWVVIVVMELPTGMLADGKSRIWSMRVGIVLFALGAFVYTFVQGVKTALIGEILIGIGCAFVSGSEDAWLTDALNKRGESHLLGKTFGTKSMVDASGAMVGGVMGAILGLISFRLAWVGAGFMLCGAAWVTFRKMDDAGEVEDRVTEFEALKLSCVAIKNGRGLMWIAIALFVYGLVVSFNHLWQPLFKTEVGQGNLAWIWIIVQGSLLTGSWFVRRWGVPEGRAVGGIVVAMLMAGSGIVLVGVSEFLPVMLMSLVVHEFGRGLFRPMLNTYTQRRIESRYRATFASLQSLLGKSGLATSLLFVWFLAYGKETTGETITFIWVVCGSLLMIGAMLLWIFRSRAS